MRKLENDHTTTGWFLEMLKECFHWRGSLSPAEALFFSIRKWSVLATATPEETARYVDCLSPAATGSQICRWYNVEALCSYWKYGDDLVGSCPLSARGPCDNCEAEGNPLMQFALTDLGEERCDLARTVLETLKEALRTLSAPDAEWWRSNLAIMDGRDDG